MKKEKLYKIEKDEQKMIDAFKATVDDCFTSGKYARYLDYEEVHKKDGYCIIAVLDYGKFKARVSYNPSYLLCDFLDVKFSLGGKYNYSIYDIFNLFDIKDFNQYYYSSIDIKENMAKDVVAILDMINKYSYDIEKATEPQNIITLDANVESDYKNTFVKDKEESWREDINEPLALDIIHPYFTSVSSATDSNKLLKKMKKQGSKGNLGTIYEQRLLKHLEEGNSVVNENVIEDNNQEKSYAKINLIIDACIFLVIAVIVAVYFIATKNIFFKGAYNPKQMIMLGSVTLPFSFDELISYLFAVVPLFYGIKTLFSKPIFKKITNNDTALMQRYNKAQDENGNGKKFTRILKYVVAVGAVIFGLLIALVLSNDNIGFCDDYIKFDDSASFTKVEVSNENVKIAKLLGEYDEDDNYEKYTDVISYAVYDSENHYYILEYLTPDGETASRIEKIIKDYDKEVTEYDSVRDFEEEINPIEE